MVFRWFLGARISSLVCTEQAPLLALCRAQGYRNTKERGRVSRLATVGSSFCSFVALEIGADLPSNHVIDRWLGEPIKAAILPTSIFLTNKKGFPVLSKMHQRLIFRLLKVGGGQRILKVDQLYFLTYVIYHVFLRGDFSS